MNKEELLDELSKFTGTESYYKATLRGLKLTDGMHFLREKANCYWLIDICGSVQHLPKIKENKSFIVWKIEVNKDKSFFVGAYKDSPFTSENMLYEQKGEYTDFILDELEFYQVEDVLLLKSEY